MHTNLLPPQKLQSVLEKLKRKRLTRADLLGAKGELLIQLWQQTLKDWVNSPPPQMANMDGDPLAWVEDRFAFPARRRPEVWAALLSLPGAEATGKETIGFSQHQQDGPLDNISVGTATVGAEEILLSSNSCKRADRLRKTVEKACTGLDLEKKRRKTRGFEVAKATVSAPEMSQQQLMQLPEVQAKMAEIRQRMNENWLDLKNPQFNGQSPRELARSKAGRAKLETVMKEFERRGDASEEIHWLRQQLGLLSG